MSEKRITSKALCDAIGYDNHRYIRKVIKREIREMSVNSKDCTDTTYTSQQNKVIHCYSLSAEYALHLLTTLECFQFLRCKGEALSRICKSLGLSDLNCRIVKERGRKESTFYELLAGFVGNDYQITKQYNCLTYRVDFAIEELGILIEYDELSHLAPKNAVRDKKREGEIKAEMTRLGKPCIFVRVIEGREGEGLRLISSLLPTQTPKV